MVCESYVNCQHPTVRSRLLTLLDTCLHFFRPEACPLKRFPFDSVCAERMLQVPFSSARSCLLKLVDIRCVITGCELGRVQYSDPKNNATVNGPKYLRTDFCPQR